MLGIDIYLRGYPPSLPNATTRQVPEEEEEEAVGQRVERKVASDPRTRRMQKET